MSDALLGTDVPIYDSARRRSPMEDEFHAILHYRGLLSQLISRNVKTRYKRSVLGVAWTMLNPLMSMLVLWLVFSNLFVRSVPHYPVYILSGLMLWTFFSQTTVAIMTELVWGGSLLNRIYVPPTIFSLSALGTALINFLLALIPLALIMAITGSEFTLALLFLPVSIAIVALFALGLGLALSAIAIHFADVIDMYQILLMAWMYLTPIIYPIEIIPEENRWLFNFNPMYHVLELFRAPIQYGTLPTPATIAISLVLAAITFIAGWWYFLREADEIAYRI